MKDLVELKRQFLEQLENERGRSAKTIENYNRYLERFFIFSKIKRVPQLTEEQVEAFRTHLSKQAGTRVAGQVESMKHQTQNYYLIALRAFLKFLQKNGIKTISPDCIPLKKIPDRSIDLISLKELKQLLAAPDKKTLEGKRDAAILELLFSTGLRISELCGLDTEDIDITHGECSVQGKKGMKRIAFLSPSAKNSLQDYLAARKDVHTALFIRYGRKAHDGGDARLQPRAVQRLLKSYAVQAGITRNVTPHVIRHSFATDLLGSGANYQSVQALLGHMHKSTTTQIYANVTDKHLRAVHKKFHHT